MNNPIPLGTQLRHAQYAQDFEKFFEIGTPIIERNPDSTGLLRDMARTHNELDQREEANKLWNQLSEYAPLDLESRYHSHKFCHDAGDAIPNLIHANADKKLQEKLNNIVAQLIEDGLATKTVKNTNIVQICGISYCGSTLMDLILGSLSSCCNIGESHWLRKTYANKPATPIDFTTNPENDIHYCSVCGPSCEVLTMDFRKSLCADLSLWYHKIAAQLNTETLIASDKNEAKLVENDPLLRMDCLILFKSPIQAWISKRKKLPQNQDDTYYIHELEKYLNVWKRAYSIFSNILQPHGKKIFVSFDNFTNKPSQELAKITSELGLPEDNSVLSTVSRGHAIGGNYITFEQKSSDDYAIAIKSLSDPDLPDSEKKIISNDHASTELHEQLLDKCA